MSESQFLVSLEARGLFLETRGPIVRISGIVVIFRELPARKTRPILRQKWAFFKLFAVLFFHVFSSPCLFTDNNSYILAYCRQWFSPWTLPGTPAFLYKVKFTAEITAGNFGRQCHFFANLHFGIYVFQFVQYLLSRNVENKNAKNKQFVMDFLDFGMSE